MCGVQEAWLAEVVEPPPIHLAIVALATGEAGEGRLAPLREQAATLVGPDEFVDVLALESPEDPVLVRTREVGLPLRP